MLCIYKWIDHTDVKMKWECSLKRSATFGQPSKHLARAFIHKIQRDHLYTLYFPLKSFVVMLHQSHFFTRSARSRNQSICTASDFGFSLDNAKSAAFAAFCNADRIAVRCVINGNYLARKRRTKRTPSHALCVLDRCVKLRAQSGCCIAWRKYWMPIYIIGGRCGEDGHL